MLLEIVNSSFSFKSYKTLTLSLPKFVRISALDPYLSPLLNINVESPVFASESKDDSILV